MTVWQVVNAARVLAARPRSKAAQENMDIFKEAWEKQVRLLTESVDDITTIHDFLAVSGEWVLICGRYWGKRKYLHYVAMGLSYV